MYSAYMLTNPFLNAAFASAYIIGIVSVISTFERPNTPDTIFAPMLMISLLVFSVATMGFLFFYRPLQMYLDGQKQEAVAFFLKTLGTFAAFTALIGVAALTL